MRTRRTPWCDRWRVARGGREVVAYDDEDDLENESPDEPDEDFPEEDGEPSKERAGLSATEKAAIAYLLLHKRKPTGLVKPRQVDIHLVAVAAAESTRRALNRTLDQTARAPAVAVWDRETAAIAKKLRKGTLGRTTQLLDPHLQRAIAAVAHQEIQKLALEVAKAIEAGAAGSLAAGVEASSAALHKTLGHATAIDDPVAAGNIVRRQLEVARAARMATAEALGHGMAEKVLQEIIRKHGATVGETLEGVAEAIDSQWWKIERVLVTETSRAFNHAQNEALELASSTIPGLHRRWTERVNDLTGKPLDNRVGADSIALHGQIALSKKLFSMPEGAPTRIKGSWAYPPNRPNDRAIVTPWMREWGLAGWVCQGGQRIPL